MITEDYVSFEVAKLLKEKGFNEYCRAFWKDWDNKIILCNATRSHVFDFCNNQMLEKEFCSCDETNIAAPTLQMAMKWLRETHNIFIAINIVPHTTVTMEQKYYFFKLYRNRKLYNFPLNDSVKLYFSYEEASAAAIKYCLENLI